MVSPSPAKIGRNDPCPCGSGKKYKRCCLTEQAASYTLWSQHHEASLQLTRDIMSFAGNHFAEDLEIAWEDFEMCDAPEPLGEHEQERQIFMPYFLFEWGREELHRRAGTWENAGVVARMYLLERINELTAAERVYLEQATTRPVSFQEVVWCKAGERIEVRDVLTGEEAEVVERSGSRGLKQGDLLYAQVWHLPGLCIFGCCAPVCIPPKWKSEVVELRKRLRKKIAKQNRDLTPEDLVRYADDVRETYLDIRDTLRAPLRLANTDGDPLHFHTLTFSIASAEETFQALAPLAWGRAREELLDDAKLDEGGKLLSVEFDWLKKGNRKMPSWESTILGSIKISEHTVIAEVNSEKRANRIRAEIEKRLGASVTHQSTTAKTLEEMQAELPKRGKEESKIDEKRMDELLRDPEVRRQLQVTVQKQVEAWVHQKVPALGGRTPMQAVKDPDGREIVESLLVQWERHAQEGLYSQGMRPDIGALRRILNLPPSSS